MKKKVINIFIILLFCLLQLTFNAFAIKQDGKDKHYHCGIYFEKHCYDLDSFKYDEKNNKFYIDVTFSYIDWGISVLDSPYDKNYASHIIFATTYSPDTDKVTIEYKGFISSRTGIINGVGILKNVQVYYKKNDKKYFTEYNKYLKQLIKEMSLCNNDFYWYKRNVKYLFYGAYKRGELFNITDISQNPSFSVWEE